MGSEHPLVIRDVWYRYPGGDWVLKGVNLAVRRGEAVLIIGGTGSGKTTLARILNGSATWIYGGELRGSILVEGLDASDAEPWELSRRIHVVGQNPYMYFTYPLLRDDLEAYAYSMYEARDLAERALRKAVESMSVHSLLDKYFFELSGGQARRALVAKSMISDPSIIVFDEPLMWLDDKSVNEFTKLAEALRFMGKTLVFMEHRFTPLLGLSDRVLVLRNGVLEDKTMEAYMLKHESATRVSHSARSNTPHNDPGVVLEARDIWYSVNGSSILRGVSLTAREGDFIYIYGGNGSGKTTLLRILAGYLKPSKGRVWRRSSVVYVPQNIHLFYTEESVSREVERICSASSRRSRCIEEGYRLVKRIGVDPDTPPFNLSHGQMVKLAVGLAGLRSDVGVVLLDEPFSGLTYVDRVRLIDSLPELGKALIIAVSNRDVLGYPPGSRTYLLEDGLLHEYEPGEPSILLYAEIAERLLGGEG